VKERKENDDKDIFKWKHKDVKEASPVIETRIPIVAQEFATVRCGGIAGYRTISQ
jgi:hypothetical protein